MKKIFQTHYLLLKVAIAIALLSTLDSSALAQTANQSLLVIQNLSSYLKIVGKIYYCKLLPC
ncbi:MAG: hypothetical protein HC856_08810 [Pseudanabaena sp. RU_4_16]|nr:hypothetical protein [Pseudanabaena sp. RU_4_16]